MPLLIYIIYTDIIYTYRTILLKELVLSPRDKTSSCMLKHEYFNGGAIAMLSFGKNATHHILIGYTDAYSRIELTEMEDDISSRNPRKAGKMRSI